MFNDEISTLIVGLTFMCFGGFGIYIGVVAGLVYTPLASAAVFAIGCFALAKSLKACKARVK